MVHPLGRRWPSAGGRHPGGVLLGGTRRISGRRQRLYVVRDRQGRRRRGQQVSAGDSARAHDGRGSGRRGTAGCRLAQKPHATTAGQEHRGVKPAVTTSGSTGADGSLASASGKGQRRTNGPRRSHPQNNRGNLPLADGNRLGGWSLRLVGRGVQRAVISGAEAENFAGIEAGGLNPVIYVDAAFTT